MRDLDLSSYLNQHLNGGNWLLVFDRDGTLAPHTPRPDQSMLRQSVTESLDKLAKSPNTRVAILSARSLRHLQNTDFPNSNIILGGNYGLEILLPEGIKFIHPQAIAIKDKIHEAKEFFMTNLRPDLDVIVDDHDYSLCLHWNLTPKPLQNLVHDKFRELKAHYPELTYRVLPESYEVLPPVKWDKAQGLDKMVTMIDQTFAQRCSILYVGDSDADEPAFVWVNERNGISIKIGSMEQSHARYCLNQAENVPEFIDKLLGVRSPKNN